MAVSSGPIAHVEALFRRVARWTNHAEERAKLAPTTYDLDVVLHKTSRRVDQPVRQLAARRRNDQRHHLSFDGRLREAGTLQSSRPVRRSTRAPGPGAV